VTSRRTFLAASAAALAAPSLSWARAATERRLVVVVLRGGVDGLSLLPPHGDPDYAPARRKLAIPAPGGGKGAALPVSDLLGLHPALPTVAAMYAAGEARLLHAVGWPGTARSHFEAQDLLEGGGPLPRSQRTGWLGRALQALGSPPPSAAVGAGMPLLLRGSVGATVVDPGLQVTDRLHLMAQLPALYAGDPALSAALSQSVRTGELLAQLPEAEGSRRRGRMAGLRAFGAATAAVLTEPGGARVVVVDVGGWDTHAGQQNTLSKRFAALDTGLAGLRDGMGALWAETAVIVVTEFGRTVEANGTGGTDHGTGAAALLLGGAVRGGVHADWPGLAASARQDGRDLRPTTDLRAVFKGLLRDHLGVPSRALASSIFPESDAIKPLGGLIG